MTPELKQKWIEALKSGEYPKGKGQLKIIDKETSYCCLGVLSELLGHDEYKENGTWSDVSFGFIPDPIASSIGISHSNQNNLAHINDQSSNFDSVILYIEKNL